MTALAEPLAGQISPQGSLSGLYGSTTPRLCTAPLVSGAAGPCGCGCALSAATSAGFMAVQFAERVMGVALIPWQRWWLIHALELCADGSFRFKTVLTLVARQQGKSWVLKILALYFMYLRGRVTVLGAAQSLDIAREAWQGAVELAEDVTELRAEINNVRRANGEQCLTLASGARYRIAAANRGAGRGLSVDLLILDELREHRSWDAWGALSNTTRARPNALVIGISNAGDEESVVLNALRSSALSGEDETMGLFEWSAPDGCALDDPPAWAASNPALGYTVTAASIRSSMNTDPPAVFRTETLCQRVDILDVAIDPAGWTACADPSGSLADVRSRIAACVDVAPDGAHVTLAGAAVLDDDRVRVEVFGAWGSTEAARAELPGLLGRIAPAAVAWFPSGPAAALAADLRALEAVEIKGAEVLETCQEFADLALGRRLLHPSDPLLNAHVAGAQRLVTGEGWRFQRRGAGRVDGAYAAAGAVHAARTLPPPIAKPRSWVFA